MNDGGSAFPGIVEQPAGGVPGMSLRDYFAGQALYMMGAGLLQLQKFQDAPADLVPTLIAEGAYELADAMLKERAKV